MHWKQLRVQHLVQELEETRIEPPTFWLGDNPPSWAATEDWAEISEHKLESVYYLTVHSCTYVLPEIIDALLAISPSLWFSLSVQSPCSFLQVSQAAELRVPALWLMASLSSHASIVCCIECYLLPLHSFVLSLLSPHPVPGISRGFFLIKGSFSAGTKRITG